MKKIFLLLSLFLIVLTSQAQLQDVNARYISGSTLKSISRHTLSGHMIFVNPSNGRMYSTDSIPAWITISPSILNSWSLTGNAGIDTTINFLGTTDLKPLLFRVNNNISGRIDPVRYNTSFGYKADSIKNVVGYFNTLYGAYTGKKNQSINVTAFGYKAAENNTLGGDIVAIGVQAAKSNEIGSDIVAIGDYALEKNLSGNHMFAGGQEALTENISGSYNTATGSSALHDNQVGSANSAYGYNSASDFKGDLISAFGAYSADAIDTGSYGSYFGAYSARRLTSGSNNICLGSYSGGRGTYYNNRLYINSLDRGDSISDKTKSIIYGEQNVTATNQYLRFNANTHVSEGSVLFDGSTGTTPVSGAGTRMMWIPSNGAFRAGRVDDTQWDNDLVGLYSTAIGRSTTASGVVSTAMGVGTTAIGSYSTAMGQGTIAGADASTAMGYITTADGLFSTAMGQQTTANGSASTAMGRNTTASNDASTAMGYITIADGYYSTAMGRQTTASGSASTAMGRQTTASGSASTAMGRNTTASNDYSTAMGYYTTASGNASTAIGNSSRAIGASSFAGGRGKAYGDYSFAFGDSCRTSTAGSYGIAMGYGNKVTGQYGIALGLTNTASAWASFASGELNTASGENSFVSGIDNLASGNVSFAGGKTNVSSGFYTVALGNNNFAKSISQTTLGAYCDTSGMETWDDNDWVGTDPLLSVGNGFDESSRNNALTILKNGTTYIGDASSTTDPILTVSTTDSTTTVIGNMSISETATMDHLTVTDSVTLEDALFDIYHLAPDADSLVVADDGIINLRTGAYGELRIYAFNSGMYEEFATAIINTDGSVYLIINSSDVTTTGGTDGKLNIYDAGAYTTIENKLGGSRTIKYVFTH